MTDDQEASDYEDELFDNTSSEELPSFSIGLSPRGDDGSAFKTENDRFAPLQRSNYVERNGTIVISCRCLDVIHGLYSAESEISATLIVLQFRFNALRKGRRIQRVNMYFEFGAMKHGESDPEVFAIAPEGTLSLVPTTQHEELKRNVGGQLGAAAPVGGLTATGTVGWEKSISKDTNDQTTVIGSIDLKGRNWGKPNSASWTLLENQTTKSGVPTSMRTAILLKRKDESPFQCVVKIDAEVDIKSSLERVFGRKLKDDPVLFDPELEPTHNLQKYDIEELGSLDLEKVCDVTMTTVYEGAIKKK